MTIDPIEILEQLVRINSVNAFYPDGPGEGGVADYVERFWNSHGIANRRQSVLPGRDNIIAEVPARVRIVDCFSKRTWIPYRSPE